ncbi:hypothetical protein [Alteromonas gilva]|uniref:Uncharacterized protein n=1 Tax=Alteromonas gilva TaxID=2987522 RepID=A0ABT5KWL1_9ALTE|nr:hypothetical protein [Alteromonas gilva]MDC8829154.1 hypothetical protein [Alteromonas gilva]
MQKRRFAMVAVLLVFLAGCTQTGMYPMYPEQKPRIVFSDWYLRGVFNWWEAKPAYQLQRGNSKWYVDVELIADGQPYDFKFSNANWTLSQTCGGSYKGLRVILSEPTVLSCAEQAENLQFIPKTTATYRFAVTGNTDSQIILTITQL